jgi:DNA-binding CsgD family transcriptional regulator
MTPDERRALLEIVDRRHAVLSPDDEPLRLSALADKVTDTATVAFMVEWIEALTGTVEALKGTVEAQTEIMRIKAAGRTLAAVAARQKGKAAMSEVAWLLHEREHLSNAQIAAKMKLDTRTVERYLADRKVPAGRRSAGRDDDIPALPER